MSEFSENDENESKEDGSVWTSYSDLFTTMAIIFLVMFVFALLRSGVKGVKVAKEMQAQKEYLEGKVPVSVTKENSKRKSKLDQSIEEMDEFNDLISKKMQDLNTFSKKMKKHKVVIKELLKDQANKEAVLAVMKEKSAEQKEKVKLSDESVKVMETELKKKVEDLDKSITLNENLKRSEILLKTEIQDWEERVRSVKEEFAKQEVAKKQELLELSTHLAKEKNTVARLNEDLIKENNQNQESEKRIDHLKDFVEGLESKLKERKNKLSEMVQIRDKNTNLIDQQNTQLKRLEQNLANKDIDNQKYQSMVSNLQSEIQSTNTKIVQLKSDLENKEQTNQVLGQKIVKIENQFYKSQRLNGKLEEEARALNTDIKNLNQKLTATNAKNDYLDKSLYSSNRDNFKLKERVSRLTDNISTLEGSIKGRESKITDLNKELISLQQQYDSKSQNNSALKNKMAALNQNVQDLTKTIKSNKHTQFDLKTRLVKIQDQYNKKFNETENLKDTSNALSGKIRELRGKISQQNLFQKDLEAQVANVNKKLNNSQGQNQNHQLKMVGLNSKISELQDTIKSQSRVAKGLNDQLKFAADDISGKSHENRGLKKQISLLNRKMGSLNTTVSGLKGMIGHQKNNESSLKGEIKNLQGKVSQKVGSNARLSNKIGSLDGKMESLNEQIKGLKEKNSNSKLKESNLNQKLNQMAGEFNNSLNREKGLENNIQTLNAKLRKMYTQMADLKKSPKDRNEKVGLENKELQGKLAYMIKKMQNQKGQINDLETALSRKPKIPSRVQRKIASVQNTFRENVGKKIAAKLSKANLNVYVDPSTGNVVLRMNKDFTFKRNSSKLKHTAKATLRKIVPLYVEALFNDKSISSKIDHINIIGHASPRWRQKYVNPNKNFQSAYNYNLDLSSDRARSIVKYIFTRRFGKFPFKWDFRKKVQAIGKSFSMPITRAPATRNNGCGKYDCKLSRRVEISFTLKDNKEAWNSVDKINKSNIPN